MRYLLIAFVLVPLAELYLLLWISRWLGFWPTVALTLLTGVVGGSLAKREGFRVLRQWQTALDRLERPAAGLVEGVLVLIGGAFLLTPGVLTDVGGVLLLLPSTRRWVAARVKQRVDRYIERHVVVMRGAGSAPFPADEPGWSAAARPEVIDTTFEPPNDREGSA